LCDDVLAELDLTVNQTNLVVALGTQHRHEWLVESPTCAGIV
jgi:hypothetical protein